jgi:hypothetical protein
LTLFEIAMGGAGRAEGGAKPFFHLLQNLIYTIVLRSGIIFHFLFKFVMNLKVETENVSHCPP